MVLCSPITPCASRSSPLAIWVVLFPVLVQGLIVYAVVQAKGEKRENDAYRHRSAAELSTR